MGKTKTTIIDDSKPVENAKLPKKLKSARAKLNPNPATQQTAKAKLNPNLAKQKKQETKATKAEDKNKPTRGIKYSQARQKVERNKTYSLDEAIELAKQVSYSKFDGTLEIHINANIKNLRGLIALPFASGKKLKIIAFGKDAQDSGADMVGDDDALSEIEKGKISFDVLVATPEWMPKMAKAAKILGPRGLMPNPKNGTISTDLKKTISEIQSGKTEYKSEKNAPLIHLGIGKVSQPTNQLSQNIKILLNAIGKTKIRKAVLAPTMGPSVKIDLSSL